MTAREIMAEFEGSVNALVEQVSQDTETGLPELVRQVAAVMRHIGRLLVALLYEVQAQRQRRPVCPGCGRAMVKHGSRPRVLATLVGDVRLALTRYRCRACGREECPQPGLAQVVGCCSAELWSVAVELAVALPYERAEALLGKLGLTLSDSTLQALVLRVGTALRQPRATPLAEPAGLTRVLPRPQRLYLLVDGRSVRVDGQWRELRVGAIFETDRAEPDARGRWPAVRRLSSFVALCSADEFMERFFAEARARGVWDAREVVLLADGAPWIWDRLPSFVPCGVPCIQLLDFYHAAEHIHGALAAVFAGAEAKLEFWSKHLRGLLKAGEVHPVRSDLRRLRDGAPSAEAKHRVQLSLDYLERHRDRLNYFQRHWEGYYIGSGRVESLCKQLGLRFKGCGMDWSRAGLEALLEVWNHTHRLSATPLEFAA